MKCPYCNKEIYGMTGLQEAHKFQSHLGKCKKHPDRKSFVGGDGKIVTSNPVSDLLDALKRRADCGQ